MASAWTDELKSKAVDLYTAEDPTAENSMEIVQQVADELGFSVHSVRMILSKAGVYIAKTKPAASAKKEGAASKAGGTRVSKESAHSALADAISALGHDPDMEIISKLTGKAAMYLASVMKQAD